MIHDSPVPAGFRWCPSLLPKSWLMLLNTPDATLQKLFKPTVLLHGLDLSPAVELMFFSLGCSSALKCISHSGISTDFSQLSGFTGPASTLVISKRSKGWVPVSWLTLFLIYAGARTGHPPASICHSAPWFPSEENLAIAVPAKSLIWILSKAEGMLEHASPAQSGDNLWKEVRKAPTKTPS